MKPLDRSHLPEDLARPFPAADLFLERAEVEDKNVAITLRLGTTEPDAILPYFGTVGLQAFITSALAAGHLAFGVEKKSQVIFFTGADSKTPVPDEHFTRFASGEPLVLSLRLEEKRSRPSSSDPALVRKVLAFDCDNGVLLTTRAEGHFSLASPSTELPSRIYEAEAIRSVIAPYLVEHACLARDRYELVKGSYADESATAVYRMTSFFNEKDFHLSVIQTDLLIQELAYLHAKQALGLSLRHRLGYSIRFNALTTDPESIRLAVRVVGRTADRITYAFVLGTKACTGTIEFFI